MIIALYAGLLGFMAVALGISAGMVRGKLNVPVGDGGNPSLILAMRRHGNFAEWVPLALILIGLLESNGVAKAAIHAMGASLVVARASHALSLTTDSMRGIGRVIGALGTTLITLVASAWCVLAFIRAWT